jgi:hypothetical protein
VGRLQFGVRDIAQLLTRRIDLIDEFGPDIEYDLLGEFGIDIHDYFAARRPWAQLERLISRLPRYSHYKAALESDERLAEIALQIEMPNAKPYVPLVGYDETVVRLDNVYDAINNMHETLVAIYSKKGSGRRQPNRAPRPETAQERVKRQKSLQKLDSLEERMIGGR